MRVQEALGAVGRLYRVQVENKSFCFRLSRLCARLQSEQIQVCVACAYNKVLQAGNDFKEYCGEQ
jgi:hypothetical protein